MKSLDFLRNIRSVELIAGQWMDSRNTSCCCPLVAQLSPADRAWLMEEIHKGGGPTELNVLAKIVRATGIPMGNLIAFQESFDAACLAIEYDEDQLVDLAMRLADEHGLLEETVR